MTRSLTDETTVTDATFLKKAGFLSVDAFAAVLSEIAEQLHRIDSCLKTSDTFDLEGFHKDVASAVARAPSSDAELRMLKKTLDQEQKDRLAAIDPWARLGVEWEDFHPSARTLLDDPFFWDEVFDFAPHGNDTGSDLLACFSEWNEKYPERPAHEMARSLLIDWDIAYIDLECVDDTSVRLMLREDDLSLTVTDDATIAVAFASVKLRDCCDRKTGELALKAMERERLVAVSAGPAWEHAELRIKTLGQMANVLARMPESFPSV